MNDTSTAEPTINDLVKQDEESGLDLMASLVDLSQQLIKLTNDQSTAHYAGTVYKVSRYADIIKGESK